MLVTQSSSRSTMVILPIPDLARASDAHEPTPPMPMMATWAWVNFSRAEVP